MMKPALADHNTGLESEGIVINQFRARATLPQQIINELREEGLPVLSSFLSSSVRIKESHQQARPMIHLDRSHKLAVEFGALFDELETARRAREKAGAKKRAASTKPQVHDQHVRNQLPENPRPAG